MAKLDIETIRADMFEVIAKARKIGKALRDPSKKTTPGMRKILNKARIMYVRDALFDRKMIQTMREWERNRNS